MLKYSIEGRGAAQIKEVWYKRGRLRESVKSYAKAKGVRSGIVYGA